MPSTNPHLSSTQQILKVKMLTWFVCKNVLKQEHLYNLCDQNKSIAQLIEESMGTGTKKPKYVTLLVPRISFSTTLLLSLFIHSLLSPSYGRASVRVFIPTSPSVGSSMPFVLSNRYFRCISFRPSSFLLCLMYFILDHPC